MKTLLVVGLISLVILIIILTTVGVHLNETRKMRQRLGKSQAHPDSVVLMEHVTHEQEMTRQHVSAQMATNSNDESTTKGVVIDIRARLEALISTINAFVRGINK